ncbi:hypothetical protein G7Y89_g2930 [Cudoniella acicularis]|uniref:Short-chain dehydrogenase/reductase 3 n=1 Tax=Cudoniella acicularis TaxID=354080 RepID=A0A8H4W6H1_9HELO|nr:hypothetical protein G7Y89_g2930 [Cudoniella acicularis]
MILQPFRFSAVTLFLARRLIAQTIINGQIFTPGIAIVDAPQPNTPLGGDFLQVALDVTSAGQLQLPPYPANPTSAIYNITIFLSSYTTGKNFTISNGTASAGNASLGEIMQQEPSSTVKHVNWIWPDCLVGNGNPTGSNDSRGAYNNFRLNGTDMYTIFDLPIKVTNEISAASDRPSCDALNNPLLSQVALNASANSFTRIAGSAIETTGAGTGLGGQKPDATPKDGLGGAGTLTWQTGAHVVAEPRNLSLHPVKQIAQNAYAQRLAPARRYGLTSDPIGRFIKRTALNPAFPLALILLARYTKRGSDFAILHETAYSRLRKLFYFGLIRLASNYLDRGVLDNWTTDKYVWSQEIVLITGGAGGIGGNVVRLLAEKGIKVVVLDVIPMTFEAPANVFYYKCDITSPSTIAKVAAEIRKDVGNPTILINNAGVARGKDILKASEKDVRFTFDVNTLAHYWMAKEFVPSMVEKNHGMIVTVASFAAYVTVPNMVDYAASKAAAQSFHEGLTAELKTRYNAPRVRTVVINQGYTKTPLFQGYYNDSKFLAPTLEPETVAEAIVKQVLSGHSGQVIVPGFGTTLTFLRGLPHWYQIKLRNDGQKIMTNWHGRQVIDLEKWKTDDEKKEAAESASTVLVPPASE